MRPWPRERVLECDEDVAAMVGGAGARGQRMDEMNENFATSILRVVSGRTSDLVANEGIGAIAVRTIARVVLCK